MATEEASPSSPVTSPGRVLGTHVRESIKKWTNDADLEKQKAEVQHKKNSWGSTLVLGWAACGVIFGDIGTSPLYVFSSTFTEGPPTENDVLGAMSIIFWTITLLVVVKYLGIVLEADDDGEGGTFALYSLLCRHAGLTPANSGAPDAADIELSRYSSAMAGQKCGSSFQVSQAIKRLLVTKSWARGALLGVVLLMTSMVMGDGVLTPAQSVLGAIYGLQVKTNVHQNTVVGVSIAIIVLLFAAQRFGTNRLGAYFSPIVLIYFLLNIIIACTNIHRYDPSIFRALSPHYIYYYFRDNKHQGWQQLAGLFLSITGAEALYADLGHFNKTAIRLSFMLVAYPSLIITYLGQAAWLLAFPEQVSSTFYASIPFGDGFYWVVFIFATAAACIASQAMISAVFSIVKQSVALGCFPNLTVIHFPSSKALGSVYIPEINVIMMVLTVIVVAVFKTTVQLGLAYGVAVSMMMFGTDLLISLAMLIVWQTQVLVAITFFLFFAFLDMSYVSANLEKVPHGGWFALMIAGIVFFPSVLWWWGTHTKRERMTQQKVRMQDLLALEAPKPDSDKSPSGALLNAKTHQPLLRLPSVGLMYSETLTGAPPLLPVLVNRWGGLHKLLIFVTVRHVPVPTVTEQERLLFQKMPYAGVYRCVVRYGYHDVVNQGQEFVKTLLEKVVAEDHDPAIEALASSATPENLTYILSSTYLVVAPVKGLGIFNGPATWVKSLLLETGYGTMARTARKNWESFHIPVNGLFEVGTPIEA